jgi:hypothetical protein
MDRLWESWQDGGWGMWPILLYGSLTIVAAARFAWRGEHRLMGFIRWMALTTVAGSFLAFSSGMHAVFNYLVHEAAAEDRVKILFEGTKEASNCLSFGLILLTLICLLVAVGYRRFPAPEGA